MKLLRQIVEPHLETLLAAKGIEHGMWASALQPSRESDQGDLTLPCFAFASILRQAPQQIADAIANEFPELVCLQSISAVNGYLNFTANPVWLAEQILAGKVHVGDATKNSDSASRSVLIEHTSANPNGPFHVGRARNAILGDTLVRLHRLHGDEVRAEYYVDDMGKQVGCFFVTLDIDFHTI